jgi:hypothetical protein
LRLGWGDGLAAALAGGVQPGERAAAAVDREEGGDRREPAPAREHGGPGGPLDAERGGAEVAVDQDPVEGDVDEHRDDAGEHREAGLAEPAVPIAEPLGGDDSTGGEQADHDVVGDQRPHRRGVAEGVDERARRGDQAGVERGADRREGERVPGVAAHAGDVAAASELRGEALDDEDDAHR